MMPVGITMPKLWTMQFFNEKYLYSLFMVRLNRQPKQIGSLTFVMKRLLTGEKKWTVY